MFKKNKKEEDEVVSDVPKLSLDHFYEISELVKTYGGTNKVLEYWGAVVLDSNKKVTAIKTYFEMSQVSLGKYQNFEPLKGIRYMGMGTVTYVPYNWCSEWIDLWAKWVREGALRGDINAMKFINVNRKVSELKVVL